MITLAIETSCDETAVAILKSSRDSHQILSSIVSSQVKIHAPFGGVVPNLASRAHLQNIIPCLNRAFKEAKIEPERIDTLAVTEGPGLIPALLIGTGVAKTLAYLWQKPIVGINHLEGHIFASRLKNKKETFPMVCLIVSGGHTQLVLVKDYLKYKLLGQTRDDAAGEAFDKVAKLLNLAYPGGPIISKWAKKGDTRTFAFPRPMIKAKDYDFSFSGLKTAVLYTVRNISGSKSQISNLRSQIPNLCASFQQAVIDVLISKTLRAAKEFKAKSILIAGGVAANYQLRQQFKKTIKKELPQTAYLVPDISFCTDNAAMIAIAGYYHALAKDYKNWPDIEAQANLKLV